MNHTLKTLIPLSIVCALLIGYSYTDSAWSEPASGTIAATNVAAPINVGTSAQSKNGVLGVNGLLSFGDIEADGTITASTSVNARQFCDESGGNCTAAADLGGGGVPVLLAKDIMPDGTGIIGLPTGLNTVPLTTLEINDIGATLSGNQITLPAGNYYCSYAVPVNDRKSDTIQTMYSRLQDITNGTTLIQGQSMAGGDWQSLNMLGEGKVSLAAATVVRLQVYVGETGAQMRDGDTNGPNEVYAQFKCYE